MRSEWLSLDARVQAADPARSLVIDERARELLRARIGAEPQRRRAWDNRLRARLRRLMIPLPSLAVLGGVGLGAESAWCAPCRHHALTPTGHAVSTTTSPDLRITRQAQPAQSFSRRSPTSGA